MVGKEETKSLRRNGFGGENEGASVSFCPMDVPELRGAGVRVPCGSDSHKDSFMEAFHLLMCL